MYEIFKEWIKTEMREVLKARFAFIFTLIIAFSLAYGAAYWRYERISAEF